MNIERLLGYSTMGAMHKACSDRTDEFLALAAAYNNITADAVVALLESGKEVDFGRGDAGAYYIRDANAAAANLAAARARQTADTRPLLRCRCGNTGRAGAYPFSTLASSGRCDDCV